MVELGPLIIDIAGTTLTAEDRVLIEHPLVGGILLFSRNYQTANGLKELTSTIHAIKPLWICVDQEGGRIQRFKEDLTPLPALQTIGKVYEANPKRGEALARASGLIMALELKTLGIDFSFAPVLDQNVGHNEVIGDRSFSEHIPTIIACATAYCEGLHEADFPAIGKHYPGHGWVTEDSHHTLPIDNRSLQTIENTEGLSFKFLITNTILQGIMASHIVYQTVDPYLASASEFWLKQLLRQQWGFNGVIFSDCLNMAGAASLGTYPERVRHALNAGCDKIILANNRSAVIQVLENTQGLNYYNQERDEKFIANKKVGQTYGSLSLLKQTKEWNEAYTLIQGVQHDYYG